MQRPERGDRLADGTGLEERRGGHRCPGRPVGDPVAFGDHNFSILHNRQRESGHLPPIHLLANESIETVEGGRLGGEAAGERNETEQREAGA